MLKPGGAIVITVRPSFFAEQKDYFFEALVAGGHPREGIVVEMLPYGPRMEAPVVSSIKSKTNE